MSSALQVCEWLGATAGSIALRESAWVYPIIESVHVLGLCVFVGLATLLDLRLVGMAFRTDRVSEVAGRLLPWTLSGFAVMVFTGVMLFYSDPMRFYGNVFFRIKLVLLILAGLNAWVFHATVYLRVAAWDMDAVPPRGARAAGAASLVLWMGVVTTGRMIAYNWFK
jgi:hypothetical protein